MKRIILIFGLIIVFLAGCSCAPSETITGSGDDWQSFSGSIEDLLAKGDNLKCEIEVKDGDNIVSGTTYLAGSKARTEMKLAAPELGEKSMDSYVIVDEEWMYTWSEQYPQAAMKIKKSEIKDIETDEAPANQEYNLESYQTDMNYKCKKWIPDNSMFVPPADINFMDFTETIKQFQDLESGAMPSMGNEDGNLCSTCDFIPDEAGKQECLESLGCN